VSALGVQLYSVRERLGGELPATLTRLAELGFSHVEPYDILTDTGRLKSAASAAGLQIVSVHAKITELDADRVLDAAAELGAQTVIVPWVAPATFTDTDRIATLADAMASAADQAAARGMCVGYHNHDFEFATMVGGRPAYDLLVERLDPRVVLELDTFWASVGGADVFELLPRMGERVRLLHVKSEPYDGRHPIAGVDVSQRLGEVLALARPSLELPVVEVVVEGDVFPVLARNAEYFAGLVAA
jgi:sugar phosphate isomerase/epimerase